MSARRLGLPVWGVGLLLGSAAFARGPSPYLPLNLEPEIERQIERVLILADKPVMTRPIPVGLVLDALPAACADSQELCQQVRRFLDRYMHDTGIDYASVEVAAAKHDHDRPIPDQHGLPTGSHYEVDAAGYWQPYDHLILTLGGIVYQGRAQPTGTMLSTGWDFAQLDLGWRDHQLSPMTDSPMIGGTEAPTMPSATISNYKKVLGLSYEIFVAEMSKQRIFTSTGQVVNGNPLLDGFHVGFEPAVGWSFGLNRLIQYGGGSNGGTGIGQVLRAFFNPVGSQNPGTTPGVNNAFGNQEASMSSRFIFPGKVPFAVYFEYAGEDSQRGRNYMLGDVSFCGGIHFPRLWRYFDVNYEVCDWQEAWYVHGVFLDGMTNDHLVIGNWFGDNRQFNDAVGGQSHSLRIGWEPPFGGLIEERFRLLMNETYGFGDYYHGYEGSVSYSRPWRGYTVGGEIYAGRDVFGSHFARIAAYMRLGDEGVTSTAQSDEEVADSLHGEDANIFVDLGATMYSVLVDLTDTQPRYRTSTKSSPHIAVGARRAVSEHQDLGARIEGFDIDNHLLLAARLLDYRYRFSNPISLSLGLGGARYSLATAAFGYYYTAGMQYRGVLPGWDLNLEGFYGDKVARRHVLPSDPHTLRPDSFYDITGLSLSLSKHF